MKLLAPITALIAAASAGQIYTGQTAENYVKAAELYQSGLEYQQNGLYSDQSQAHHAPQFAGHDVTYNSRPSGEKTAKILSYNMENNGHEYKYAYETENGIKAEESGHTSEAGTATHGAYSYTGDDGKVYTVTYTADEHGFHPQGAHLPTPPPIPEAIQKSLEHNAREESSGIFDDGQYKEHGQYKEQLTQYKEVADHGGAHGFAHGGVQGGAHGGAQGGAHGGAQGGAHGGAHGVAHSYPQYEHQYQTIGFEDISHGSGAELAYHAHH